MNTAFLTEMGFNGKIPDNHVNARTEMAWMITLQADHFNIYQYTQVKGYDVVFVILPKGLTKLNSVGLELQLNLPDKDMAIYSTPIIEVLKTNNKKVCYIQEGPSWFFNDYTLTNQFNFYNRLSECDIIFAHNHYDKKFYAGLFPGKTIKNIPTLMVDTLIKDITPVKENKVMVGGNFCRWYGGFQSYMVSTTFEDITGNPHPIYTQTSHCMQPGEDQVPNLHHLPRLTWLDWIKTLSTFKYAVHLMSTVAAGTFSLNCAYFGIPCIGNERLDTQQLCFPELSIDVNDINSAKNLAELTCTNQQFYDNVSKSSMELCRDSYHVNRKKWLEYMEKSLE